MHYLSTVILTPSCIYLGTWRYKINDFRLYQKSSFLARTLSSHLVAATNYTLQSMSHQSTLHPPPSPEYNLAPIEYPLLVFTNTWRVSVDSADQLTNLAQSALATTAWTSRLWWPAYRPIASCSPSNRTRELGCIQHALQFSRYSRRITACLLSSGSHQPGAELSIPFSEGEAEQPRILRGGVQLHFACQG
jgi:hypothetical protein